MSPTLINDHPLLLLFALCCKSWNAAYYYFDLSRLLRISTYTQTPFVQSMAGGPLFMGRYISPYPVFLSSLQHRVSIPHLCILLDSSLIKLVFICVHCIARLELFVFHASRTPVIFNNFSLWNDRYNFEVMCESS
ncbi:hypothetical protein BJ912DRAFT_136079 [Pholiota molesta]|nr:hypothetical protein BJ912DRAFT_136079 [Pholiota molesta]